MTNYFGVDMSNERQPGHFVLDPIRDEIIDKATYDVEQAASKKPSKEDKQKSDSVGDNNVTIKQ